MKTRISPASSDRASRGSAFVTVMMFTCVMFLLGGSIIKWSLTERRLNLRNAAWLEARNGAEAVAEYGFAQIVTQFNSYATPPSFNPSGATPLVRPGTSFFAGGNITSTAWSAANPYGVEVIGGVLATVPSTGALYYVDPLNPDNARDTLVGQWVFRRDIQVLARASVVPPSGSPITAYVTEKVSIRGAPLFAHAIFYSDNDLEAAPGPVLDVYGPVHVNGNMFPMAQGTVETGSANSVNFRGPVSITGNLYHSWGSEKPASQGRGYSSSSATLDGEPIGYDPITFINSAGTQVNLKGSDGVWKDSTMGARSSLWNDSQGRYTNTTTPALAQLETKLSANFRQYAAQTWNGNLQTAAHGVQAYHPISFSQPIDAAGNLPDPHAIIDPPDTALSGADAYYTAKKEVEAQKLSMQAGLYVQVTVTPGVDGAPDDKVITLYGPANSAPSGTPAADIGPNGGIKLGTAPANLVKFIPFKGTATGTSTAAATRRKITNTTSSSVVGGTTKYRWNSSHVDTTGGTLEKEGTTIMNGTGGVKNLDMATGGTFSGGSAGGSVSDGSSAYTYNTAALALAAAPGGSASPSASYTLTGPLSTIITDTSGAQVNQGMYDQRQGDGVNLVQLDMAELRAALNNTNTNSNADGKAIVDSSGAVWGGTGKWNGGVYIEVKSASGSAHPGMTSVALANGKVASGNSMLPTVNSVSGLTIATNAPVYILGNFNSDGANASTSTSATMPDDGKTNAASTPTSAQIPVAIAADAISILSPDYFGAAGANGSSAPVNGTATGNASSISAYTNLVNTRNNASGSCEVAAAFITGVVSTNGANFSGGVHNLPRFLENWGSNSVAIRGSLVSLFKSKVATGPWMQRYYSAPRRVWGFDRTFSNGTFPPLTPRVMSYRRVDFTDLNAATYQAARHALWPSVY